MLIYFVLYGIRFVGIVDSGEIVFKIRTLLSTAVAASQAMVPLHAHAPWAEGHFATWLSLRPDLTAISPSGGLARFHRARGA
jgi:hypothetical protein